MPVERVGAQGGAQLGHQRGGRQAVADDVADGDAEAPAADREQVVPVAAEARCRCAAGQVAGGELDPGDGGELAGERALRWSASATRRCSYSSAWSIASAARSAASWSRSRSAVGEVARGEGADVQDADDAALDEERDAEEASGCPSRAGAG